MGGWDLLRVGQVNAEVAGRQAGRSQQVVHVLIVRKRGWIFGNKFRSRYEFIVIGNLVRLGPRVRTWLAEDHAVIQRLEVAHEIAV